MKTIGLLEKYLEKFEGFLIVLFLSLMIVFSFLQVILRNFFDFALSWADVFTKNLVLWVGFIGAALATKEERHINIEVIAKFLPSKIKSISKIIINSVAVFISLLLLRASYLFIVVEKESERVAFLSIPMWVTKIIIPVGFLLITIHFILKLLGYILVVIGRSE